MKRSALYFLLVIQLITACTNRNTTTQEQAAPKQPDSDSIAFTSGYSEVNGIKMYYELHGNKGDTLVLIHGGGSTIGTTFGTILPLLSKSHYVVAVELQAHGHTGDRDAPESFEQDADDVAMLLSNLKINKASFFGFSNGGNTAMQIAVRHPQVVNKLILASAFYKREGMQPGFFEGMNKATLKDMPQDLQAAFLAINPDSSKLLNMFNKDSQRMKTFKDWQDETLQSITAPTLIINGDKDVVTNAHAVKMSQTIKNARLMILPTNHGSYMGEIETPDKSSKLPELTMEVISTFLNAR